MLIDYYIFGANEFMYEYWMDAFFLEGDGDGGGGLYVCTLRYISKWNEKSIFIWK